MMQIVSSGELRGYLSGETDFRPAYDRACASVPGFQDQFDNDLVFPLVDLIYDSGRTGVLAIIGRADRVDTPGLSREEIRQQEYDASSARCDGAFGGIYVLVQERFGLFPDDWSNRVHTMGVPTGASRLLYSHPDLSELERQQNRRVTFTLVQFTPG